MREKPKDNGRLLHINEAIDNIHNFLTDKTAEDFVSDKMLYFAVVKNMEIIGEAAYMLTPEFKQCHQEVAWEYIVKMRHILVHGYYHIDANIVWTTIINDLPSLKEQIQALFTEIKEE